MSSIDPRIFRAYDIRGRAGEQLSEEAAELIGRGFGSVLRERTGKEHPTVVVGRDARTHGPGLERAVTKGLTDAGCAVLLMGQTPSPVNYFTICTRGLDGGVQVTASHNPAHDNGLKLQTADAEAHAGDDLQLLRQRIERQEFASGEGSTEEIDAVGPYLAYIEKLFRGVGEGLKVVIDAGNGVAGPAYTEALKRIGCTVTELYTEPDGTFPNHPADPSKHDTLRDLQAAVQRESADIGLAFDGDGDRLGIVDEAGMVRTADETILLLARDHLSRHPGLPVIFTVSNSGALETEITKWGGVPVMCKVGHSFVEHAMREHDALLGGEQSGHFFCGEDYFHFDDALVAALRVLSILRHSKKLDSQLTFSSLFKDFPRVYQASERRPHCPDDRKTAIVAAVADAFAQTHPVNLLDGARIDFGDGAWAGIRQSNTSPCLSICIEARSAEKLKEMEEVVLAEFQKYPEVEM